MLETLLKILSWDLPAPEIYLEEDGDLCVEWPAASVSINKNGGINWAGSGKHGKDIEEVKELLCQAS